MNRSVKRLISITLALLLAVGAAPFGVYGAAQTADPKPYEKTGTFHFAATLNYSYQGTDQFSFSEKDFRQSSYYDNILLAKLSSQLALSSASYFDKKNDPRRADPSLNAFNVISTLRAMGFQNVETNQYYGLEELEDTVGVAVGRRTVTAGGKKFTLLAVVPRSENYKQEWAGNFEVGDGMIHQGFKAARDEVLRFVKQYVSRNKITGNLKIWITGHSRGAAVSNMVGGFFAGGGAAYLGSKITLTPQDVYCYCFAAPLSVIKGASKKDELSVTGARGGRYANDTPGAAYVYTGSGTLNPKASIYKGIKVYQQDPDLVTKVPPAQWGFDCYGTAQSAYGKASYSGMMAQMKRLMPVLYEEDYLDNGNPETFAPYTYDIPSLSLVEDTSLAEGTGRTGMSMKSFLEGRIAVLAGLYPTNAVYESSGAQDVFVAVGGVYGLLTDVISKKDIDVSSLIRPMILTYLAYASERITEERAADGITLSETDAIAIWLAQLAHEISGLEIPQNPTADYLILAFTEFIAQYPDSEATNKITEKFSQNLTDKDRKQLENLLTPSQKKAGYDDQFLLRNFLIACARGPLAGSWAYNLYKRKADPAAEVRQNLYDSLTDVFQPYPGLNEAVNGGSGSLNDVAAVVISNLTGTEGMSLGDAADAQLSSQLGDILYAAADKAQTIYGPYTPDYKTEVTHHIDVLLGHITILRRAIAYFLLDSPGEPFSIQSSLANACTFAKNIGMIPPTHYGEGYIAWMSARAKVEPVKYVEPAQPKPAVKKAQKIKVTVLKKTVRKSSLKKKAKTITALKLKGTKGKVTFKKISGSARLKVNKKTGRITVRKATSRGTFKIKVRITAAGSKTYKKASRTVVIKVKVR